MFSFAAKPDSSLPNAAERSACKCWVRVGHAAAAHLSPYSQLWMTPCTINRPALALFESKRGDDVSSINGNSSRTRLRQQFAILPQTAMSSLASAERGVVRDWVAER